MIKVEILGCGASLGVPVIGCKCDVCMSSSPFNKRRRSSIIFTYKGKNILVDFGPDIRDQLLKSKYEIIDSAILTHIHSDHICCIDDLRPFKLLHKKTVEIYSDKKTCSYVSSIYRHLVKDEIINLNKIDFYEKKLIEGVNFQFLKLDHGNMDSLGIRVNGFAYLNDLIDIPKNSDKFLYNLEILIIDCIDYKSSNTHSGLEKVLIWNDLYKPKRVFLTNMSHKIDYDTIKKILPNNISPSHDGMKFEI